MRLIQFIFLLSMTTSLYADVSSRGSSSWWERLKSFFITENHSRSPSGLGKVIPLDFDLNREVRDEECRSGDWLGLNINSVEKFSGSAGGHLSIFETKLVSNVPYLKTINENNTSRTVEVIDNIYYSDLLEKYPELINPRKDGFYLQEDRPKIPGISYLKDDGGRPLTPRRTWWYDTFGRNGNQVLKLIDNPLKLIKDSKGRIIRTEELDSPKLFRTFEFFPRKQVADAQVVENKDGAKIIKMTLPNGEVVEFDADTGAVISGAFKKELRTKSEYQKGAYLYNPTKLSYIGSGAWIEIDETNRKTDSRREVDDKGKSNIVYLNKNNPSRKCAIASSEIWALKSALRNNQEEGVAYFQARGVSNPGDSQYKYLNTGYNCFFLKYRTDEEMDAFFKSKCGFGFLD